VSSHQLPGHGELGREVFRLRVSVGLVVRIDLAAEAPPGGSKTTATASGLLLRITRRASLRNPKRAPSETVRGSQRRESKNARYRQFAASMMTSRLGALVASSTVRTDSRPFLESRAAAQAGWPGGVGTCGAPRVPACGAMSERVSSQQAADLSAAVLADAPLPVLLLLSLRDGIRPARPPGGSAPARAGSGGAQPRGALPGQRHRAEALQGASSSPRPRIVATGLGAYARLLPGLRGD
jgi:hypothetical protein